MRLRRKSPWVELQRAGRIQVGPHSYGTPRIQHFDHDGTRLIIGPFCSIAEGVTFVLGGNHNMGAVSTYPFRIRWDLPGAGRDGQPWSKGDVIVDGDVWIGTGALILSGVHLGAGSVVAAGAVVSSDVAPYTVVAGNPAREMKHRFSVAICKRLVASEWWTLPDEVLIGLVDELTGLVPLEAAVETIEGVASTMR